MFKKSLIMLLCLSLVAFTMLTGCGKDEKDSEKNETTETTEGVSKPNYEIEYYDGKDGVYAEVNGEKITTLSPGFVTDIIAAIIASVLPQVTTISESGSIFIPLKCSYFTANASRKFCAPHVSAY